MDCGIRRLWQLRCATLHIRKSGQSSHLQAVRVPLAADHPTDLQLDVWLALLRRLAPIFQVLPSVFLPAPGSEHRGAVLCFRTPSPEDFAPIFAGSSRNGWLIDLVSNESRLPSDGFAQFKERLGAQLNGHAYPLEALVELDILD